MSCIMRKPDFGVSDQVLHKPGCTTTQDGYRGLKFRIQEEKELYSIGNESKGTDWL